MFIEVHEQPDGNPLMVDLNKAETIRDGYVSFQCYAVYVKESYEELQRMLQENNQ